MNDLDRDGDGCDRRRFLIATSAAVLGAAGANVVEPFSQAAANETAESMHFDQHSSLVGFSAHPDDPKSFTGAMLRCLKAGGRVRIIQFTLGETFSHSTLRPGPEMGRVRRLEELQFVRRLELDRKQLVFLGLPSQGLEAMRHDFWACEGEPFFSATLKTDRAADPDVPRPGLPFFGQSALNVLKDILAEAQPTHVLTHHRKDDHPDHRAVAFFTQKTIEELCREKQLKAPPKVFHFLVYSCRYHWAYAPGAEPLLSSMGRTMELKLTDEEKRRRYEACLSFAGVLGQHYIEKAVQGKDEYYCVF
jgi:LmbE family N-acetylglucosaminyl deacetylase